MVDVNINSVSSSQNSNQIKVFANMEARMMRKREEPSAPIPAEKNIFVNRGIGPAFDLSKGRKAMMKNTNESKGRARVSYH